MKLVPIRGESRLVPVFDYSVAVKMQDQEFALRCSLSDAQLADVAVRLSELKQSGAIDDWDINQSYDLAVGELLAWLVSSAASSTGAEA